MRNVYIAHRGELSLVGLQKVIDDSRVYTCVGASRDGYEAVRDVLTTRPDVVVLSQVLEGMNGICTAQEITREWPDARILGVVERVSGEAVIGFLDAGARVVLSEGECLSEFHAAVRRMGGARPYLGEIVTRRLASQGVSDILVRYSRARRLSQREVQVLQQIAEGRNTREVAEQLCVSVKTVESHRARIMEKLSIRSIAGLTKYAIQMGITEVTVY